MGSPRLGATILSTAAPVVLSHRIHSMTSNRVTWFSVAAAVALSFWALVGLQAETASFMERCQSAGRSFSDCALTASGR